MLCHTHALIIINNDFKATLKANNDEAEGFLCKKRAQLAETEFIMENSFDVEDESKRRIRRGLQEEIDDCRNLLGKTVGWLMQGRDEEIAKLRRKYLL